MIQHRTGNSKQELFAHVLETGLGGNSKGVWFQIGDEINPFTHDRSVDEKTCSVLQHYVFILKRRLSVVLMKTFTRLRRWTFESRCRSTGEAELNIGL